MVSFRLSLLTVAIVVTLSAAIGQVAADCYGNLFAAGASCDNAVKACNTAQPNDADCEGKLRGCAGAMHSCNCNKSESLDNPALGKCYTTSGACPTMEFACNTATNPATCVRRIQLCGARLKELCPC